MLGPLEGIFKCFSSSPCKVKNTQSAPLLSLPWDGQVIQIACWHLLVNVSEEFLAVKNTVYLCKLRLRRGMNLELNPQAQQREDWKFKVFTKSPVRMAPWMSSEDLWSIVGVPCTLECLSSKVLPFFMILLRRGGLQAWAVGPVGCSKESPWSGTWAYPVGCGRHGKMLCYGSPKEEQSSLTRIKWNWPRARKRLHVHYESVVSRGALLVFSNRKMSASKITHVLLADTIGNRSIFLAVPETGNPRCLLGWHSLSSFLCLFHKSFPLSVVHH